jgi:hypothetical protein
MKQLNLSAGGWMRLLTLLVLVASSHVLSAQNPNPCDDGNPATTDYIDDEGRCHHIYNLCCDDGDPTTIDRVNPETGECENIPDPSLLDCDGDGVADQDEADCNENGVPDDCEQLDDCNNNGIPDECENLRDFNNNGIPDECEDCNGNGIPDYRDNATDCNRNGIPDECEDLRDCNGNGWPDVCEPLQDCNSNGIPDECENLLDCDGNGINDICQDDFADCNGNGIMDKCEGLDDCNNNGVIDACEPDTDKDGIIDDCDVEECDGIDNDGDGFIDEGFDADKDGIKDCFDVEICNGKDDDGDGEIDEGFPDTDGDGIPDCRDNCPDTPNPDQTDVDGDGIGDACDGCNDDQDADNDGIPDCRDNCINTPNPDQMDSDGDGVGDACDNCVETPNADQENADGDEYGDACDTCPDDAANKCNDCINVIDGGAIKGNQTGCGEFDPDVIMSTREPAFQQGESAEIEYIWMKSTVNVPFDPTDPNTPWEMIPGSDDASYDPGVITETTYYQRCARGVNCNDYVGESNVVIITITPCEICDGVDNDGDGQIDEGFPDTDKDGIADCADNCDDRDDDNDGIPNCDDICLLGDDNADADEDGVPDACDTCPFESNPGAEQDADDDNDGIPNACDNCAEIGNGNQTDTDGDGIGNACDTCNEGDDNADSDGDGIPDACDTEECDNVDNDGDGMVDEGLICDGNCSVGNPMQDCDVATIQYIVSSNDDCGNPTELVIPVPDCVSLGDVSVMGEYSSVAMGDSDCEFYPGESAIVISLDHGDGAPYIVEVSIEGTSYESGNGSIGVTDGDRCSITDNMPQFVCFDYTDMDSDGDGIIDECDEEECDGIDNDGDGDIDEGFADEDGDNIGDECDDCVNFKPGDDGGEIEDDQMICKGETPDELTSISLPSGHGQGDIEYIWVKYEGDNPPANVVGNNDWMMISGATGETYQPGALMTTTWFIRCARRAGCDTYWAESNKVRIKVKIPFEAGHDGGEIEDDQMICEGEKPNNLTNVQLPAGGYDENQLEFVWMYWEGEGNPPANVIGNNDWQPWPNSDSKDLHIDDVMFSNTTWFIRCARVKGCGGEFWGESNMVRIKVKDTFEAGHDGGEIEDDQMICEGEKPNNLTNVQLPAGGYDENQLEFVWMYWEGEGNPPANVIGNNDWQPWPNSDSKDLHIDDVMFSNTTWFIRCARVKGCGGEFWGESNKVKITVEECNTAEDYECPTLLNNANSIHVEWIDCYTIVVCTGKDLSNVRLDYGNPGYAGNDPSEGEIIEDQSGHRNAFTSNKPIIGVWVKAGNTDKTGPNCDSNGCGQYWSAPEDLNCDDLVDPASQRASQGLNRANTNQLEQGTNVSLPKVGIWPNPTVDGNLNLDLSDYAGETAFVQIYDMNGTIMYSNEFREVTSETYQILIEDLESGLYKLRTIVKGQPMTHSTFVVQNK